MTIKVLGSGCSSCKKLYETTIEAIKELNSNIELEYVSDIEKICSYGIMSFPALVINEKVVSQGRVLNKDDIIKLIQTNEVLETQNGSCDCGGNC
ncbi:MAG: thioredoxin family protein [Bacilli bacterium]|nr:thioredoxin family protein [Bacilli bacterium]MDD4298075.1 thioredoxin family protein [Bacilli bacterium]MDD4643450.1 thioredoxin family protein [Bacilli bacterium]